MQKNSSVYLSPSWRRRDSKTWALPEFCAISRDLPHLVCGHIRENRKNRAPAPGLFLVSVNNNRVLYPLYISNSIQRLWRDRYIHGFLCVHLDPYVFVCVRVVESVFCMAYFKEKVWKCSGGWLTKKRKEWGERKIQRDWKAFFTGTCWTLIRRGVYVHIPSRWRASTHTIYLCTYVRSCEQTNVGYPFEHALSACILFEWQTEGVSRLLSRKYKHPYIRSPCRHTPRPPRRLSFFSHCRLSPATWSSCITQELSLLRSLSLLSTVSPQTPSFVFWLAL